MVWSFVQGGCPPDDNLPYTPFRPYFHYGNNSPQTCWAWASCVLEAADESRKQQFGATALVMGLIPVTLKDIAWPERRMVPVSRPLPLLASILVLALGLVPAEPQKTENPSEEVKRRLMKGNWIARKLWGHGRWLTAFWIIISSLLLVGAYAGLTVMEIYSKRSALGCLVPLFVALWYIAALVPATIHTLCAKLRRHREMRQQEKGRDISADTGEKVSAIQGANEDWPVQLSWAIYYIAGTLIWTSIMAVTVVELTVWVALGVTVSAISKILAFLICLAFEITRNKRIGTSDVMAK